MVTRDILYLTIVKFLDVVVKRTFRYYLWVGICLEWGVAIDTYPEVVMKIHFILLLLVMYLLADG